MSYCCDAVATDSGTLIPMVDSLQQIAVGRLKTMMADAAYCSILDLRGCADRGIELLAPFTCKPTRSRKRRNRRRQTARSHVTNFVSMMHGIVISALPVASCRTQVANENNVMEVSRSGNLVIDAFRHTAESVHSRHNAFGLVHRVERSSVLKDKSYWMLSVRRCPIRKCNRGTRCVARRWNSALLTPETIAAFSGFMVEVIAGN